MKIFLIVGIIICFGMIGYLYKLKLKQEILFLNYVYDFEQYYASNITLFKNNVVEIIDNYIIMQKNKNANNCNLFIKTNNIYSINKDIIKKYIQTKEIQEIVLLYFENLGKVEYYDEKEKNEKIEKYLKEKIKICSENCNNKGTLYFKILLSIGVIVAILLW